MEKTKPTETADRTREIPRIVYNGPQKRSHNQEKKPKESDKKQKRVSGDVSVGTPVAIQHNTEPKFLKSCQCHTVIKNCANTLALFCTQHNIDPDDLTLNAVREKYFQAIYTRIKCPECKKLRNFGCSLKTFAGSCLIWHMNCISVETVTGLKDGKKLPDELGYTSLDIFEWGFGRGVAAVSERFVPLIECKQAPNGANKSKNSHLFIIKSNNPLGYLLKREAKQQQEQQQQPKAKQVQEPIAKKDRKEPREPKPRNSRSPSPRRSRRRSNERKRSPRFSRTRDCYRPNYTDAKERRGRSPYRRSEAPRHRDSYYPPPSNMRGDFRLQQSVIVPWPYRPVYPYKPRSPSPQKKNERFDRRRDYSRSRSRSATPENKRSESPYSRRRVSRSRSLSKSPCSRSPSRSPELSDYHSRASSLSPNDNNEDVAVTDKGDIEIKEPDVDKETKQQDLEDMLKDMDDVFGSL